MNSIFSRQEKLFPPGAQEKLSRSAILIAGLGGLGCVVAEALARLGVGTLYLVDEDRVDPPGLNRQIFYRWPDIGRPKVEVAAEWLQSLRPGLRVIPLPTSLTPSFPWPEDLSGVVDALDNWASRFLLEDFCETRGLFRVHAGLFGLFGQVTTLVPGKTPRLRDLFAGVQEAPSPPPVAVPICMVLGAIQALETVKILLDIPDNLVGKLLLVDLRDYRFELVEI